MIPQAEPGEPPGVIDLCRPGRAVGWCLGIGASVLLIVVLIALAGPSFFTVFVGIAGLYAVGASRAMVLRRRGRAVLSGPLAPWGLSIKVAVISRTIQPVWSRPKAVLTIGSGMVHLWPLGLDLPVSSVRVGTGSRWTRGGLTIDAVDGRQIRFTFVNGVDIASNWAWLVDSALAADLARVLLDETTRAMANLPVAGWYPDPGAPHQSRWWDGRGWSHHVQ